MTVVTNGIPTQSGRMSVYSSYISTAGTTDTTSPNLGPNIDNSRGDVEAVFATGYALDKTGTSPTLQLVLEGGVDGTAYYTVPDSAGSAIQTSATSISGTDGTAPNAVTISLDTKKNGRDQFPPKLRVKTVTGGSASPGFKGFVSVAVQRRVLNSVTQAL